MLAMELQSKGKRKKWDDLKPHGEERCERKPSKKGGSAGRKSVAQRKTGLGWREKVSALCGSWLREK